jgi:hypothetical protein
VDGGDDLRVIDSAQVTGGDREVRMPELALDHDQRDSFAGHLDGVRVPQLVRREPSPNPGAEGRIVQLGADPGRSAWPPAARVTAMISSTVGDRVQSDHDPKKDVVIEASPLRSSAPLRLIRKSDCKRDARFPREAGAGSRAKPA